MNWPTLKGRSKLAQPRTKSKPRKFKVACYLHQILESCRSLRVIMEWFFSTERGLFLHWSATLCREQREVALMVQPLGPQHNQKTILVVDDEPDILDFVSKLLVDGNYHVLTGSSGEDGLQQSRDYNGEIHLLLTDFQMPPATACRTLGRLRVVWASLIPHSGRTGYSRLGSRFQIG